MSHDKHPQTAAALLNAQPLPLGSTLDPAALPTYLQSHRALFTDTQQYVDAADLAIMREAVALLHRIGLQPAWQAAVLSDDEATNSVSRHPSAASGVCFGYDFHLTDAGPRLIEINTNASGAMLNAELIRAQKRWLNPTQEAEQRIAELVAMFQAEWALWLQSSQSLGIQRPLRVIAIVDETPEQQHLYPDFLGFQRYLQAAGIQVLIGDPAQLSRRDGRLYLGESAVDLVYNRLTDFDFSAPHLALLREAWLADEALITPHPHAYALYADKRNLNRLQDAALLAELGLTGDELALLKRVLLPSEPVLADKADEFWARRKSLFFKPASGYGGKAVYRGQNVTRGVFQDILASDYVAQELAPPSLRMIQRLDDGVIVDVALKADIRCYAYQGHVQQFAARIWQGQTTNFRTPGGGFAPVVIV